MVNHSPDVFWNRVRSISVLLLLSLTGCGGGSSHTSSVTPPSPPPPRTPAASAELFAQHIQALATPWPTIAFKEVRIWSNVDAARWANIQSSQSAPPDFSVLDQFLAEFYQNGITDVMYTIGQVPQWASSVPSDTSCDFASQTNTTPGGCDLPSDINADGTGTDATYIAFITALALHVNDSTYLKNHAHITYWEPWNEWYRNPVVYPNFQATGEHTSINATYAQMVRMTQDLRCVLTGNACVSGGAYTKTGIDPSAKIVSPSAGEDQKKSLAIFDNFLYCDGKISAPISTCNTNNAGSSYVDVINTHFYEPPALGLQPESLITDVGKYASVLSATDQAKPFWSGEGSWGEDAKYPDPDLQAAWVARYYLSGWSAGLSRMYWYAYDSPKYGQLWNGSSLTPAGQAYNTLNKWALGATMSPSGCSNSGGGTVWTCSLTLANGNPAQIMWDTSQSCSNGSCPTAPQSVSNFANYQDLTGTNNAFSGTVQVGIKPILLTATAADAP